MNIEEYELALELCPVTENVAALLVEVPWNAVAAVTVQSGVRGHKSECAPALVQVGGALSLKAGDVVAEIAEAAHAEGQTAAERLPHGLVVGEAVAAPVYRELLTADGSRTREQARLVLAVEFFQYLKHSSVVEVAVLDVHFVEISAD